MIAKTKPSWAKVTGLLAEYADGFRAELFRLGYTPLTVACQIRLNDDLGTPQDLAVVYGVARRGNSTLAADDKKTVTRAPGEVRAMLGVLGLDPLSEQWVSQRRLLRGTASGSWVNSRC